MSEVDSQGTRRRRIVRRGLVGAAQILGVVVAVALAVYVARTPESSDTSDEVGLASEKPPRLVRIIKPTPANLVVTVNSTGSVVVRNYVDLVPQTTGRVTWLAAELRAGRSFKANQELLRIDDRDYELAYEQASANLQTALATLRLQQAESDAAKKNYRLLHPDEEVPILVAKEPQIEQSKARVSAEQARVNVAKLDWDRTRMNLPFDGRVVESKAEVGQLLTRGQPFGKVFADASLEISVSLSTDELAQLEPVIGRQVTVYSDGSTLDATVVRVLSELDPRTRVASVILQATSGMSLTPGTFVNVEIIGPRVESAYLLGDATEQIQGTVWIVAQGKLQSLDPTVRSRSVNGRIVDSFGYGEGIVFGNLPGAREGMRVRVTESEI